MTRIGSDLALQAESKTESISLTRGERTDQRVNVYYVPSIATPVPGAIAAGYTYRQSKWSKPPAPAIAISNRHAARTLAHEVGHVLEEEHHPNPNNLMFQGRQVAMVLLPSQCDRMRTSNLLFEE